MSYNFSKLSKLFLQMPPADEILALMTDIPDYPSLICQQMIVREIFQYSGEYKASKKWINYILKKIVKDVERTEGGEIADELADIIIDNNSRPNLEEDPGYISFELNGILTKRVSLKVLRSHNQVGLKSWEAGIFLAEFCSLLPSVFNFKSVCELGAGVGSTSLILANSVSCPKQILITDYTPEILANIAENVIINHPGISDHPECDIRTQHLDWLSFSSNILQPSVSADIVLAADCTYSEDICLALGLTIKKILLASKSSESFNKNMVIEKSGHLTSVDEKVHSSLFKFPFALVACTVRNEDTFYKFIEVLEMSDLHFRDITVLANGIIGPNQRFYYPNRELIKLICITI